MVNRQFKTIGFHILGWTLFFGVVIAFVSNSALDGERPHFLSFPFVLFILVYLFLFYFNTHVLLPHLYFKKKYALYFLVILILFAALYALKPFDRLVAIHNETSQSFNGPPPPPVRRENTPPRDNRRPPIQRPPQGMQSQKLDIVSIVLFMAVWSASSVMQIFRQWQTTERRAMQAEADKVAAELSFLKAQINPHFLFNTLNNIYSLAIIKSENTADAILKLSGILRYVTDDVRNDFVPLKSEVDCARNYIELQKLRLSKKVTLEFLVQGDTEEKKIMPLLFMTFIENAFKYGISNHELCTIVIKIIASQQNINLYCHNKIIRQEREEGEREGVGINNAKKRLAYLYPGKYLLNIDTENDFFTVDLTVTT